MKKILIIPPLPWYMNNYAEQLIRHLSDEFFIEIGFVPYPPYENFLDRYPETSPFMRNPDEYDLIVPLLPTHWGVIDKDKYRKKTACIWYEPSEGERDVVGVAALTPMAEKSLSNNDVYWKGVRFGVDTNLFKPFPMVREDDLLHVGVVGTHINPRRMNKEVLVPLSQIKGVRLMIWPNSWENNGGNLEQVGGKVFLDHVVSGEKNPASLPNIYNRMDVYIRTDSDPGFACPILEAAACGIPVITTDQGIDHLFTEAGAGIMLKPSEPQKYNTTREWCLNNPIEVLEEAVKAVIYMRDHPQQRKAMGIKARWEVEENWTWEKQIPAWRQFFRECLKRV